MDPLTSFNPRVTLGALEIGVLISYVLFGVTTVQMYIYCRRFPDDSRVLKALTAFVWVCDVVHAACLGHILYTFTVSDYTHPERVLESPLPRSFSVAVLFTGFDAVCVHSFFAFRIYAFTKKLNIPTVIWSMAFVHLLGMIGTCVASLRASSMSNYVTNWEWLLTTNWSMSVATDFVTTTTLVVVLNAQRASAQKKTSALIDKVVLWTLETGMLTSAVSILMLVCFVTWRGTFFWLAFYAIGTRLFSNSLMASLNSRTALRAMNDVPLSLAGLTSAMRFPSTTVGMDQAEPVGQCSETIGA
ncbi:hypothetical protein K438DRAFT_1831738 [Mycena galopus ATCC 62051]|nr:hypothetical protein K438DRAFT_1831738 [Mycena galopus ATCC 62051]